MRTGCTNLNHMLQNQSDRIQSQFRKYLNVRFTTMKLGNLGSSNNVTCCWCIGCLG